MMDQETQKLAQLLIQETTLAKSLLELMLQEKAALETSNVDKLNTINCEKTNAIDQLERISRSRAQLLLALSTKPTTIERMNDYIEHQPSTIRNTLNLSVDTLELSLEQCRHQNSVNGMVISMTQRNVQRNINILKGVDQQSMTYTQKGQTTSVGNKLSGLRV